MINLRGIANSITTSINPNTHAVHRSNQGTKTIEGGKREAIFVETSITIQLQSLETADLEHLNLINQQGQCIYAYINSHVSAIRRTLGKGSDQLTFKAYGEDQTSIWNVQRVIESYPTWVKVLLWRQ